MPGFLKNKPENWVLSLFILCTLSTFFCKPELTEKKQKEETQEMRDINLVLKAHTREIMAIPGVVGLYVGATDDNKPCLKVMVVKETDKLKKSIPKKLEGYPVFIHVTGEIKPM
jgi:hypothetical protein